MTYRQLFLIFLKAGFAFGGGLGILSTLEQELVTKHKIVTRKEFLTMYGIGKIVPSGTVTALAVGFGYAHKKLLGSIIALVALILPGLSLTVLLASLYSSLRGTEVFDVLQVSVIPAAVALIVISAINLGKDAYTSPIYLLFAIVAFVATFFFAVNPSIVLLTGGLLSIFLFPYVKTKEKPDDTL